MAPTFVLDEEESEGVLLAPAGSDVDTLDVDAVLVTMDDVVVVG